MIQCNNLHTVVALTGIHTKHKIMHMIRWVTQIHIVRVHSIKTNDQKSHYLHSTQPITKTKYAEIFLCYRQLFINGNVIIGELEIFGMEVFLCCSRFFVKSDFVIDGVGCRLYRFYTL